MEKTAQAFSNKLWRKASIFELQISTLATFAILNFIFVYGGKFHGEIFIAKAFARLLAVPSMDVSVSSLSRNFDHKMYRFLLSIYCLPLPLPPNNPHEIKIYCEKIGAWKRENGTPTKLSEEEEGIKVPK